METLADRRRRFREQMNRREAMIVPGAGNALTARVIADQRFEAVYVTGAGIANTHLGAPDIGLVTLTELAATVSTIAEICHLPLVVDIDTGFGNAINTRRTVRLIERAGGFAMQIEDQVFPKKCGHFSGKAVIPVEEAVSKIKAAVDAREDENTMIIARTDARAIDGIEAALDRAEAFIEAGADMTFVEAPRSEAEMEMITKRLPVPQVANMVVGGKTPLTPQARLVVEKPLGHDGASAAMRAMTDVLSALKLDGDVSRVIDRLADFDERQRLVDKASYDALEERYRVE